MKGYMSLKRKKGGGGKGKEEGEVDEVRFVIAEMVQYVQGGQWFNAFDWEPHQRAWGWGHKKGKGKGKGKVGKGKGKGNMIVTARLLRAAFGRAMRVGIQRRVFDGMDDQDLLPVGWIMNEVAETLHRSGWEVAECVDDWIREEQWKTDVANIKRIKLYVWKQFVSQIICTRLQKELTGKIEEGLGSRHNVPFRRLSFRSSSADMKEFTVSMLPLEY